VGSHRGARDGQQQAARDAATRQGRRGGSRTVCDDLEAYASILPLVVPLPPKVVPHELLTWSGLNCWLAHDSATVGSRDCAHTHRLVTHKPSAFTAPRPAGTAPRRPVADPPLKPSRVSEWPRGFLFHAPARPAHRAPHSTHRAPNSAHSVPRTCTTCPLLFTFILSASNTMDLPPFQQSCPK